MNILFVEPHLAVCGGIRRIHEIANGLVALGHTVTISVPDWVYDTGQLGGWMPQSFGKIPERQAVKRSFDVVIFNEETQLALARKIPAVLRIYYALHWAVLHKDYNVLRAAYNGGFRIIANSQWTADAMFLETGARPPVHHGGIDHDMFRPVEVEKDVDILYYGASRTWKGSYIAEEVAKRLRLTSRKFGDNSGIPQQKMAEAYSRARVFISPSWYEGWNWPALEAMACGVPVILSDDGGSADYARDKANCLIFKNRSVVEASVLTQVVLKNKRMYDSLSKNGVATALTYNWPESIKEYESILFRMLPGVLS
jgi:glycosyltransferase involved in cell wall biosynthesis